MTEKAETKNSEKNLEKRKQSFLTKFVVFLALIFFGYFGFKYWQVQQEKKVLAAREVEKFDNVDSEIFDLSKQDEEHDLSDLTINELKEKGAEFIYQMLLKNQIQIEDLNTQIQVLRNEIQKNKNQEKIGKMILAYANLRDGIFAGKNFTNELKTFEVLAAGDENLQSKIAKMKLALPNFLVRENLERKFADLIPELITNKKKESGSESVFAKIRHQISKLVVIRRVDGKNPHDPDGIIVQIEESLHEENYQQALNSALLLDQNYHELLAKFLDNLSASLDIQMIDQGILNYLQSLV